MRIETQGFLYEKENGQPIDFEKKRLQFWVENVPADIRRIEYELFVRYRKIFHQNVARMKRQEKHGRFGLIRAITSQEEQEMWQSYRNSFVIGEERKDRFSQIFQNVSLAIPGLTKQCLSDENKEKVKLVALSGSSCYGPRREGEFLSDIDVAFLLDESTNQFNFEKLPIATDPPEKQYHLIVSGNTDAARVINHDVHWLLLPHFPVVNEIPDSELKRIIACIVEDTRKRKDDLMKRIDTLDNYLEQGRRDEILN